MKTVANKEVYLEVCYDLVPDEMMRSIFDAAVCVSFALENGVDTLDEVSEDLNRLVFACAGATESKYCLVKERVMKGESA